MSLYHKHICTCSHNVYTHKPWCVYVVGWWLVSKWWMWISVQYLSCGIHHHHDLHYRYHHVVFIITMIIIINIIIIIIIPWWWSSSSSPSHDHQSVVIIVIMIVRTYTCSSRWEIMCDHVYHHTEHTYYYVHYVMSLVCVSYIASMFRCISRLSYTQSYTKWPVLGSRDGRAPRCSISAR